MASTIDDLGRCAIHTMTNKPWSLAQCIAGYQKIGAGGISVWRNVLEAQGAKVSGKMLRDAGMVVPALVRGGFFVSADPKQRQSAMDSNRVCIDEAREIGAKMVVLVVGAVPGMSLEEARKQVTGAIATLAPIAQDAGVKLAIEPLHPMYAGDRSCINRMTEARHVCEQVGHPGVGIAVDVYHVWWDPNLQEEIALAGKQGTLFAFHVCDWRLNTRDLLDDRGLMGDGCIDLKTIRGWVEAAGFDGFNEVEIFSSEYWATDQDAYLEKIRAAYLKHV